MSESKENSIEIEQELPIPDREYYLKGIFRMLKDLIILYGANADIIEAIEYINIEKPTYIDINILKECTEVMVTELRDRIIATGIPAGS